MALEPEPSDLDELAARALAKAAKSSPWLALSLLFHGAVLSVFPLIILSEKIHESFATPVTISFDAKRIDPDRNYKPVGSAPPSATGEGLDEAPVFFPDAVAAERNESIAKEDMSRIDGESLAALEHFRDSGAGGFGGRMASGPPGTNFVIGVGGGSGSGAQRFGVRAGGRQNLVARGGGSAATEAAVEAGLAWLVRHQEADGHWSGQGKNGDLRCGCHTGALLDSSDLGGTALSVLAFLTAGYGPNTRFVAADAATKKTLDYGAAVRAGLDWLASRQQEDGRFKSHWCDDRYHGCANMYGQAFAILALSEAFRLTGKAEYATRAKKSLAWLEAARNPRAAWQYNPRDGKTDLSVTGACLQALRGAKLAGFAVANETLEELAGLFEQACDDKGLAGYEGASDTRQSTTAIAIYARHFLAPHVSNSHRTTMNDFVIKAVEQTDGQGSDYYLWYYAMLGLFDVEGPGSQAFKTVNAIVTKELLRRQERPTSGCKAGSWDPVADPWLRYGGRAAATALNVLTLEVYYRYAR